MSLLDSISNAASAAAAAAGSAVHSAPVVCKDGTLHKRGECGPGNEPGEDSSSSGSNSMVVPIVLLGGLVAAAIYFGRK